MSPSVFTDVRVVGMHFRGPEVKALVANYIAPKILRLEREPDNEFDAYAIKVFDGDTHIGYIQGTSAAWIAPKMDEGFEYECVMHDLIAVRQNLHPVCTLTSISSPA